MIPEYTTLAFRLALASEADKCTQSLVFNEKFVSYFYIATTVSEEDNKKGNKANVFEVFGVEHAS